MSFDLFEDYVKQNNKNIIIFGAGTLLHSWVNYEFTKRNLSEKVKLIADSDADKWGNQIEFGLRNFYIEPTRKITESVTEQSIILIVSSYFAAMIEYLDKESKLDKTECFVAPIMHLTNKNKSPDGILKYRDICHHIPKVIHYCWFGRNPMPEKNRCCIESWRKFCPDYEIVEWNEDNYDIHKNRYMSQAYDAKKYGYVPDYARTDILYHYGGIYMDTDVEVVRSLDDLLCLRAYVGFEEYPVINFGGGSGSEKGFPLLQKILEDWEKVDFIDENGKINRTTSGYYESMPLVEEGLQLDGTLQNVKGLTVLPSEYFHPYSVISGEIFTSEYTHSIHWFAKSWTDIKQKDEKNQTQTNYLKIMERIG